MLLVQLYLRYIQNVHSFFLSDDVHVTSITFMMTLHQWLEADLSLSAISPGHQQLVACLFVCKTIQ
jgi:hypothetical protein